MKQTEIGLIPDDWKVVVIGETCKIKTNTLSFSEIGRMRAKQKSNISKCLAIKVSDMNLPKNEIELSSAIIEFYIDDDNPLKEKLIKPNAIVFPKRGAAIATNKKRLLKHLALLDPNLIALEPSNLFYEKFLFYYFLNFDLRKLTDVNTIPQLNKKDLEPLKVPLPPHKEQQSISHILTLIQTAIQKQEQLIATTTELKNVLTKQFFTEGIKGEKQKESEVGLIPKSWEVVELKKTGEVIYGIQAAVANNLKPIGTKILTNVNITLDGKIKLEKVRYYKMKSKRDFSTVLQQGDILFNWRSGSKEHVGKTAIFDLVGEYIHSSFILRIRPNEKVVNHFLYLYLNYLRATGYFVRQQTYSINAKFNKSAIEVMLVALPSKEEQLEISSTIKTINAKLEHHISKKETLTSLFKTMLQQLMTGEIRVKDISFGKEYSIKEEKLSIAAEP